MPHPHDRKSDLCKALRVSLGFPGFPLLWPLAWPSREANSWNCDTAMDDDISLSELAQSRARDLLLNALKSKENSAAVGKIMQSLFERKEVQETIVSGVRAGLNSQGSLESSIYQGKWWYGDYVNKDGRAFNFSKVWLGGMIDWWLLHPESIRITTRPLLSWSLDQDYNIKRIALNSALNIPYNKDYTVNTIKFNVIEIMKSAETKRQTTDLLIMQLQKRT